MAKTKLLFLAKLVGVTALFGWFWFAWFEHQYPLLLKPFGDWLLPLFGARKWQLSFSLAHMSNWIPYVGLVLAGPHLSSRWKYHLLALVGGLAIIVAGHFAMLIAFYHIIDAYELSKMAYRFMLPIWVLNDALPLILWLAFFPRALSELFPGIHLGRGR